MQDIFMKPHLTVILFARNLLFKKNNSNGEKESARYIFQSLLIALLLKEKIIFISHRLKIVIITYFTIFLIF